MYPYLTRNKLLKIVLSVLLVLGALISLVGCSSGTQVKKEEPKVPDVSEIKRDLVGYWAQDSSDNPLQANLDKGIFSWFKFDDTNNFEMGVNILGAELPRKGTYNVSNGIVYVSVPAMEEQKSTTDGPLKSLSAKAIENAEIVINGNKFTSSGISSNGSETVAIKITDAQFVEYSEKCKAMGPKTITIGQTVGTPVASFVVNDIAWMDEIYPPDTSGYYSYYEKQSGKTYIKADVTYTNLASEYSIPGYATNVTFSVGDNKYDGEVLFVADGTMGRNYRVEAKETARLYLYAAIPDSVKGTAPVKMTYSVPTESTYLNTYYSSSYPHDTFVLEMQ